MQDRVKKFRLATFNCNSVYTLERRAQVSRIVDFHKPDFLLLQETALFAQNSFRLKGYNIFRTDKPDNKNGTAIAFKSKYPGQKMYFDLDTQYTF